VGADGGSPGTLPAILPAVSVSAFRASLVCPRADFAGGFWRAAVLDGATAGASNSSEVVAAGASSEGVATGGAPLLATVTFPGANTERFSTTTPATTSTTATAGTHTHHIFHPRRRGAATEAALPMACAAIAFANTAGESRRPAAATTNSCSSPTGSSTALPVRKTTSRHSVHPARCSTTRWRSSWDRVRSVNAVSTSAEG
jgi:hypothetical protein